MESRSNTSRARNVLGRGLRSLIPGAPEKNTVEVSGVQSAALNYVDVDDLQAGCGQPRQNFDEQGILDLSASIREYGILQPIVIRRISDGKFEIVAGERRWRAAKAAGLTVVPCVVTDIATQDVLKVALVENIQREDLNAIEEAESYQKLQDDLGLSHDQIAQSVGKDRSTVANAMRLLKLPLNVRQLVVSRKVSMGHARALLSLRQNDLMEQIAAKIADEQLSVRSTEKLVSQVVQNESHKNGKIGRKILTPESAEERNVRRQIESALGTRAEIHHTKGKGTVVLHFANVDQLNDLIDKLCFSRRPQ